jgi:hypothetical protein
LVVLEGHTRLTATALALALAPEHLPDKTPILLGTSPGVANWPCY